MNINTCKRWQVVLHMVDCEEILQLSNEFLSIYKDLFIFGTIIVQGL